jgi:beta-phosphoglucomutase-like phosphatase (HAD superfamily)
MGSRLPSLYFVVWGVAGIRTFEIRRGYPLSLPQAHHRFHAVIGHGDHINSKPAPDPYSLAAERLGIPAALCLALEDSPGGVRSASAAGMMTVMVPDLVPPTAETRDLCVHVAESLHDVAALILRSRLGAAKP